MEGGISKNSYRRSWTHRYTTAALFWGVVLRAPTAAPGRQSEPIGPMQGSRRAFRRLQRLLVTEDHSMLASTSLTQQRRRCFAVGASTCVTCLLLLSCGRFVSADDKKPEAKNEVRFGDPVDAEQTPKKAESDTPTKKSATKEPTTVAKQTKPPAEENAEEANQ